MTESKKSRHTVDFSEPKQRLYIADLLHYLRIARPTFHRRVKAKQLPPPDGRDNKRPYWRVETVLPYLDGVATGAINCADSGGEK